MKKYYSLIKCINLWLAVFHFLLFMLHFASPLFGWTQMEQLSFSMISYFLPPFLLLGLAELFLWFRFRLKGAPPAEPQYVQSSRKLTSTVLIAIAIADLLIFWFRIRADI